jgi:chromosome segregation ATPase
MSAWLQEAFSKLNDPKLNERMAYYDRTEPGERNNELHSILGTEYRNLGSQLEAYYSQYFTDRNKTITLHDTYQAVFDNLKKQSDTLSTELSAMKASIDSKTNQYNTEAASISSAAVDLKNSASSVDRTSAAEVNAYNAKRQTLLDRIDTLDELRVTINAETETYNTKVTQYNALVVSTNELNKSLDSTLAPAPSL